MDMLLYLLLWVLLRQNAHQDFCYNSEPENRTDYRAPWCGAFQGDEKLSCYAFVPRSWTQTACEVHSLRSQLYMQSYSQDSHSQLINTLHAGKLQQCIATAAQLHLCEVERSHHCDPCYKQQRFMHSKLKINLVKRWLMVCNITI